QVGWVIDGEQVWHKRGHVAVERRDVSAQVRQAQKRAIVLQGMVRRAHDAVAVAAAITDRHYRQGVQADVVAELLERAGVGKWRDGVDPRPPAGACQPRADGYHVLLGDA